MHLEVVHNLETDSFINAFLRFIARRGCPCEIWSDNGTNIVGARTEMVKNMKSLDRDSIGRQAQKMLSGILTRQMVHTMAVFGSA